MMELWIWSPIVWPNGQPSKETAMRKRSRHGFTLGEVVIATTVVALGVLAFSAVFPAGARALSRARHRDMAAQAAQEELEYWRSVGYIQFQSIVLPGANSATHAM